jgi:guanylate kinase
MSGSIARPRRGIIVIVSAPSGAGKTTISRAAIESIDALELSISLTTRAPREREAEGVDYHFVSQTEFEARRQANDFAESARVFDAWYGTLRQPLERAVHEGRDILLDIDIQGAAQIQRRYGKDCVTIFVLPPSFKELEERLRGRGTEDEPAMAMRLRRASEEASVFPQYDYLIINQDRQESLAQLRAIVAAERLKVSRLRPEFNPWKS